jgi:hypothetical protein
MDNKEISIGLTRDEALILFEFLSRINQTDHDNILEDVSEQKVLWTIEGQLERILVEPFKPDYLEIIKAARKRLGD